MKVYRGKRITLVTIWRAKRRCDIGQISKATAKMTDRNGEN